jgi:peptidoglycan/LPS O-acetylase OafA/YrhL
MAVLCCSACSRLANRYAFNAARTAYQCPRLRGNCSVNSLPTVFHAACIRRGIAAAYAVRSPSLSANLLGPAGTIGALLALFLATRVSPTVQSFSTISFLTIAFVIIACGNTIFGFLSLSSLKLLGDISYGIYLLHGIFLYLAFRMVNITNGDISPIKFWAVVSGLSVPLICVSYFLFRVVELPMMKLAKPLREKLPFGIVPCTPYPS